VRRFVDGCLFLLTAASLSSAQPFDPHLHWISPVARAAIQDVAAARQPEIRGTFPVTLAKSLDSRKLKQGDTVLCVTSAELHAGSGLMVPTGSKVVGHVTQAEARSNGSPDSTLAIVFDKIEYAKGEEIPIKGTVQAIAPSLGNSEPNTGPAEPGSLGGGSARNNSSSPGTTPPPTSSIQISGPAKGTPILTATSQGVMGVKNLRLDANGVLTSPGKEVKLDSGIQLLVRAEVETSSQ
jgi:hypothetical protein